jgi:hypothetical protein
MKSSIEKKLDYAFKRFIRLRDTEDGTFVCCSCGQRKLYAQADAGHFINCRWRPTRWREDNVHAQCSSCNRFNEGDAAGYALFMIEKYGKEHVNYLKLLSKEHAGFTDFDGEMMLKEYRKKYKALEYKIKN